MSTAIPLISIIMPAYNSAVFLSDAIESALAQTVTDFELLIADDGSTDQTLEVARQWARVDPRVRVSTGPNGGTAAARNRVMQHARGAYFALLDSDDRWKPAFLAAQLAVFRDHPEADVVTGNAYNLGGPRDGQPLKPVDRGYQRLSVLDIIQNADSVCIMAVFRRAVFDRIGGFDIEVTGSEDYAYWVRAALAGFSIVVNPEPHAHYRRHPDSKSSNEIGHANGVVQVYEFLQGICHDRPVERAAIERQLARFERERLLITAKVHLVRGEFEAAASHFERLSAVTNDLTSATMAGLSRHMPHALLWAYRAKSALRSLRSAPVGG